MFFIASVLDVALYVCVVLVSKEHKYKYIHYKMGQVETSYKSHAEDVMCLMCLYTSVLKCFQVETLCKILEIF